MVFGHFQKLSAIDPADRQAGDIGHLDDPGRRLPGRQPADAMLAHRIEDRAPALPVTAAQTSSMPSAFGTPNATAKLTPG